MLKQLPQSINDRLTTNSSNEQIFNNAKPDYEKALRESGYMTEKLKYHVKERRSRNRKRNIIWFNPPYNKNVSTNIAKKFLNRIDKHFPRTNKLHKIFNNNYYYID